MHANGGVTVKNAVVLNYNFVWIRYFVDNFLHPTPRTSVVTEIKNNLASTRARAPSHASHTHLKSHCESTSRLYLNRKSSYYVDLQIENHGVDKDWVLLNKE